MNRASLLRARRGRPLAAPCFHALALVVSALLACGDDDGHTVDGGATDGGAIDGGAVDGRADRRPDAVATVDAPRTITLLTGDRVIVQGDGQVAIEPDPGRPGGGFRHYRVGGHHYVVPDDAARLVATGELDRRLFDITGLLELEYDDAHRADLPLIVSYGAGVARRATTDAALAASGARAVRTLSSLRGAALRVPKSTARAVWSALARPASRTSAAALAGGVSRIWLDGKRKLVLDRSAPQIGAPAAWETGYTGQGVTVSVLDTGIDLAHPDFAGRIAGARSFLDEVPDATDDVGHGTHVASILAGTGAAGDGTYRGVAPDAQLLIGKVCDTVSCPDSAILAGMEWAAANGAAVVNLSFGSADSPDVDPVEQAIDALTAEHGVLFVAAAGNEGNCGGEESLQVGSPGTADAALSVGAVDPEDELADFSCQGPRVGDGAIKPDITAPGVAIAAALAAGTPPDDVEPLDAFYVRMSGTSMATPHVAGAAAILAQKHPEWRAAELKAALMGSARPDPGASLFAQGAGRVDLARAIAQDIIATPASLSLGRAIWPHDDDEPSVRSVTYHNSGAAPLTLKLAVETKGPDAAPAAVGMFSVEPSEVTVPAGGRAQVTLTVDTRVAGPDGQYTGALVATAGEQRVRTPLTMVKEVESYDLEVAYLDRQGGPALGFSVAVNLEDGSAVELGGAVGSTAVRLPRGRYHVESQILLEGGQQEAVALFVQPVLEVTRTGRLSFDARLARPVAIRVPRPTARRQLEVVSYERQTGGDDWSGQYTYLGRGDEDASFVPIYTAHLGDAVPASELVSEIVSHWSEPHAPGGSRPFRDSPYSYYLVYFPRLGGLPTGFARQVRHEDLATVHAEYGAQGTDGHGVLFLNSLATGIDAPPSQGPTSQFRIPMRRTEYYTTENLTWAPSFWESVGDTLSEMGRMTLPPVTYRPGGHYQARWNAAVLGPGLRAPLGGLGRVVRSGDELLVSLDSLYSDAAGHAGFSFIATVQTRLYREGALLGQSDEPGFVSFQVPSEPGRYRLEVASQGGRSRLSTDVRVAWSFDSQHIPDDSPALMPVMTVEFAPRVDEYGRAPAGRPTAIPLSIARQAGAAVAPLRRLTVDASYDGGQSWQPAPVLRLGDRGFALVAHPPGEGLVSLRARAKDASGNEVEQTIIAAYGLCQGCGRVSR